ncbi:MAG: YraN family protein [Brevinematales bacterium]|nr:YraN family protein [Brevinematales bacterium]
MDLRSIASNRDRIILKHLNYYGISLEDLRLLLGSFANNITINWFISDNYGLDRFVENWFLFSQTLMKYILDKKFYGKFNIGREVEIKGAKNLSQMGMSILIMNYRSKRGEIDIIAHDGESFRFVEVRSSFSSFLPQEKLDRTKTNKILLVSEDFTNEVYCNNVGVGYDALLFDGKVFTYCKDYLI